jgi:hypothetical protein
LLQSELEQDAAQADDVIVPKGPRLRRRIIVRWRRWTVSGFAIYCRSSDERIAKLN